MKLVVVNSSSDELTYVGGLVILAALSSTDIASSFWTRLYADLQFLTDLRNSNLAVNDGVSTYRFPESEAYIRYAISRLEPPKDSDGSPLWRNKITTTGWNYQLHGIEFKTSQLDSIVSKKSNGTDHGFTTIKCYDADDVQLTTQETCDTSAVKTVVDWEPTHDYEVVGGLFKMAQVPESNMRLWVVGVPDIPAAYGGSKEFVSNVNLKFIGLEEGIKADGRAAKYLTYSATLHTNKLRLILIHPAGYKHDFHMIFEIFKP